jgi:hypothetical protein
MVVSLQLSMLAIGFSIGCQSTEPVDLKTSGDHVGRHHDRKSFCCVRDLGRSRKHVGQGIQLLANVRSVIAAEVGMRRAADPIRPCCFSLLSTAASLPMTASFCSFDQAKTASSLL